MKQLLLFISILILLTGCVEEVDPANYSCGDENCDSSYQFCNYDRCDLKVGFCNTDSQCLSTKCLDDHTCQPIDATQCSCETWEQCDAQGNCTPKQGYCNRKNDCANGVCDTTTHECKECTQDRDCPTFKSCSDQHICVLKSNGCYTDDNCSGDTPYCNNNSCVACINDTQCDDSRQCLNGDCILRSGSCDTNSDCTETDYICNTAQHSCIFDCTTCTGDMICSNAKDSCIPKPFDCTTCTGNRICNDTKDSCIFDCSTCKDGETCRQDDGYCATGCDTDADCSGNPLRTYCSPIAKVCAINCHNECIGYKECNADQTGCSFKSGWCEKDEHCANESDGKIACNPNTFKCELPFDCTTCSDTEICRPDFFGCRAECETDDDCADEFFKKTCSPIAKICAIDCETICIDHETCNSDKTGCTLSAGRCYDHYDCADEIDKNFCDATYTCVVPFDCTQCGEWGNCNQNEKRCDPKDGFCSDENDCDTWEQCNTTHTCELKPGNCNVDADCAAESDGKTTCDTLNKICSKMITTEVTDGWNKIFHLVEGSLEDGESITTDSTGAIYIAGWSKHLADDTSGYDGIIKKFTANGTEDATWNKVIDFAGNDEKIYAIDVDKNDNLFVAGYTGSSWFIKKFASDGTEDVTWNKTIVLTGTTAVYDIAIDSNSNLYVAGYGDNLVDTDTGEDWLIKKFDATGTEVVTYEIKVDGSKGDDRIWGITLDSSDNLYVAGVVNEDGVLKKFAADGTEDITFNKIVTSVDGVTELRAVTIDQSGNIYAGGFTQSTTDIDWLLVKYNRSGVEQWAKTVDGNGGDDKIYTLAITKTNSIFVGGYGKVLIDAESKTDMLLKQFTPDGTEIWSAQYHNDIMEKANEITVAADGAIYMIGSGYELISTTSKNDIWVKKFISELPAQSCNINLIPYDGPKVTTDDCAEIASTYCWFSSECGDGNRCENVSANGVPISCCVPGPRGCKELNEECSTEYDCQDGFCLEGQTAEQPSLCSQYCDSDADCSGVLSKCQSVYKFCIRP